MLTKPYKFLDYYTEQDAQYFFGREREIRILLYDVLVSRLVVLFAPTGTGKTSLINAGVRPRLSGRGYATFHIRVAKDPTESARESLREKNLLPAQSEGQPLVDQLEGAVKQVEKPIVLFFDQFEEFFIHVTDAEQRRGFISEIAKVFYNDESQIHVVFSMREEYFVDMDEFRDDIPSIFHNDSNLRLRWFDTAQAREAIVRPAQLAGGEWDDRLVSRVIDDLAEEGRVEPARLQIVCDTLWARTTDGHIRESDYDALGAEEGILSRRLEGDISEKIKDRELLQLLEKLLPELTTERDTKRVRGMDELAKALRTDRTRLSELIKRLDALHLIRTAMRYGETYIEWMSDYIAELTDDLEGIVRTIALRLLLHDAMARAREAAHAEPMREMPASAPELDAALYMTDDEFRTISEGADYLRDLEPAAAKFLFVVALHHGSDLERWFDKAAEWGVPTWEILEDRIINESVRIEQAESAVRLLGQLEAREENRTQVMKLFELALGENSLTSLTIDVLGETRATGSFDLLKTALADDDLASQVIAVLQRERTIPAIDILGTVMSRDDVFALKAADAIYNIAQGRAGERADRAQAHWERVLSQDGERLFRLALRTGRDMVFWCERAEEQDVAVWDVLRATLAEEGQDEQAENALLLLGGLATDRAVELLELALARDPLSLRAERALQNVARTGKAKAAERARTILHERRQGLGLEQAQAETRTSFVSPERKGLEGLLSEVDWAVLIRRITGGRCIPVIGPGIGRVGRAQIARELAREYRYPLQETSDLPSVAQFLAVEYGSHLATRAVVKRVSEDAEPPEPSDPDDPHGLLADLPFRVYVSTNYDDSMVQSLTSRGKTPLVVTPESFGGFEQGDDSPQSGLGFDPTPQQPVVIHIYGHHSKPESIVLTEDDHLQLLQRLASDRGAFASYVRNWFFSTSLLLLGLDAADATFRALLYSVLGAQGKIRHDFVSYAQLERPTVGTSSESAASEAQSYWVRYFNRLNIRSFWGTAGEFAAEFRQRWETAVVGEVTGMKLDHL